MAKLSMAIGDVISLIKAVIGYMHCKKMRRMVFFMNTPTGVRVFVLNKRKRNIGFPGVHVFERFYVFYFTRIHQRNEIVTLGFLA